MHVPAWRVAAALGRWPARGFLAGFSSDSRRRSSVGHAVVERVDRAELARQVVEASVDAASHIDDHATRGVDEPPQRFLTLVCESRDDILVVGFLRGCHVRTIAPRGGGEQGVCGLGSPFAVYDGGRMEHARVAVITAGGSGMGAAAARRLAADGFRVAILSSSGKGEALADELGGVGVTGSNQSNDDLKRLVDATMARWGRIDVLVNSAGHGPRAPMLEITDEQWHAGLDVYLLNVIRPTRLVAPIMQAQGGGAIINISTVWAFEPSPMFPTSGVFRAGLAAFTKLFADATPPTTCA